MNWFDNVLASTLTTTGNVANNIIDAWGQVKVAQYEAQLPPPKPVPYTLPQVFSQGPGASSLLIIGALAIGAIFLVMKK